LEKKDFKYFDRINLDFFMSKKLFVQLELGSKRYKDRVSTEGCQDVADFKDAIKNKWTNLLSAYAGRHLVLFEHDGITEIDPETLVSELFQTPMKPFVVKVDELPAQRPTISRTSHKLHKHGNAIKSSRTYLTTVATQLDKFYPIQTERTIAGKERPLAFGTILFNAIHVDPEAFPEFRDKYKNLKKHFTAAEWGFLEALNAYVNEEVNLPFDADSDDKTVVLASRFSDCTGICKRVAQKANMVSDASHMIVNNEG
jgi:hypothetical protein